MCTVQVVVGVQQDSTHWIAEQATPAVARATQHDYCPAGIVVQRDIP